MTPISEDPQPAEAERLLATLDRATGELSVTLARLSARDFGEPSLLDGWSRAHLVAHLANVADALVRMTGDALAGRVTTMYPGGREQRNADIETAARAAPEELVEHFERSATELAAAWHDLARQEWGRTSAAGTWLLVCDDLDTQWWVETDDVEVEIATAGTRADTVLRGTAHDLMALLLGREGPAMLAVSGLTTRALAFKRAFPGP